MGITNFSILAQAAWLHSSTRSSRVIFSECLSACDYMRSRVLSPSGCDGLMR